MVNNSQKNTLVLKQLSQIVFLFNDSLFNYLYQFINFLKYLFFWSMIHIYIYIYKK